MNKHSPIVIAFSLAATLAAPVALAQVSESDMAAKGHVDWATLDADGDGTVTTAEATVDATFNSKFASIDTDADGSVSQAEYKAWKDEKKDKQSEHSKDAAEMTDTASDSDKDW